MGNNTMTLHIDASAETLMRQAGYTAEEYMSAAIKSIDETFGKGYAKKNPVLVAAFMQTAAADLAAAYNHSAAQIIAEAISNSLDELNSGIANVIQGKN